MFRKSWIAWIGFYYTLVKQQLCKPPSQLASVPAEEYRRAVINMARGDEYMLNFFSLTKPNVVCWHIQSTWNWYDLIKQFKVSGMQNVLLFHTILKLEFNCVEIRNNSHSSIYYCVSRPSISANSFHNIKTISLVYIRVILVFIIKVSNVFSKNNRRNTECGYEQIPLHVVRNWPTSNTNKISTLVISGSHWRVMHQQHPTKQGNII